MPRNYVAVSAMGRDRVGLADDIAAWIVEESKMAALIGGIGLSGQPRNCSLLHQGHPRPGDQYRGF